MKREYAVLPHEALAPGTPIERPPQPIYLSLDAPALEVMTDFRSVRAVTVSPHVVIDDALERMKTSGVRMLLVSDERERVFGIITARDIQGERPVQLVREGGLSRAAITVEQLMTPAGQIEVIRFASVANARIGHVVATLHRLERQHALVVEEDARGRQTVRGVFSTSEIGKRIGRDLNEMVGSAHSLAELQHVRSGAG